MTAEHRSARRIIIRTLLTVAGVIGGLLCLFTCANMFAGYTKYHTAQLTIIAMILIALTGGAAWIIDERRIDADE
jgi:hypothetical protein